MPQQTFTNVTPIAPPAQQQTFSNVTPIAPPMSDSEVAERNRNPLAFHDTPSVSEMNAHPSLVPNARIRNMTDPSDPNAGWWNLYEGAKTGAQLASLPAVMGQPVGTVAKGLAGSIAGSFAGKKAAEIVGGGDRAQEVASDLGGVAGGVLGGTAGGSRIGRVGGKLVKGTLEDIPGVRQAGKIAQYWKETAPAPTPSAPQPAPFPEAPDPALLKARSLFEGSSSPPDAARGLGQIRSGSIAQSFKDPGAPLPESPDPALLKARQLFEGSASPPDPAAGLGEIPVRPGQAGSIAASMQKPAAAEVAPGFQRGSLQTLLDRSLGAKQLDPKVPLRNQMDIATPAARPAAPSATVPEGHTAIEGSSALRSYKYNPAAREFEVWPTSGETAYRFGDVSPEDAQAFEAAPSKGKAFQQIKNSGTLVAKRINGTWEPVKRAH